MAGPLGAGNIRGFLASAGSWALWELLGASLAPLWGLLGASLGSPGTSFGSLWPILGLRGPPGASWSILEPVLEPLGAAKTRVF